MDKDLQKVIDDHSDSLDSLVGGFQSDMEIIVGKAAQSLLASLSSEIDAAGGLVESTRGNQKFFAGLDGRFEAAMDAEGYGKLVDSFTNSFNGQFEWFDKVVNTITAQMDNPLPPVKLDRTDLAELTAQRLGSKTLLQGAVEKASARARQAATLSMGGLPVKELTKQLHEVFQTSVSEAANVAETSISTFYRTITDKGYQVIENDLPGFELRYNYEGPLDKLNRPFCLKLERLARAGKTWTRDMINKMKNGQLPNVFRTCGGYRCRHQWIISIPKGAKGKERKPAAPSREQSARQIRAQRAAHDAGRAQSSPKGHPIEQIRAIRERTNLAIAQARSKAHA